MLTTTHHNCRGNAGQPAESRLLTRVSSRTRYPTVPPTGCPSRAAMRRAATLAATRRGSNTCVMYAGAKTACENNHMHIGVCRHMQAMQH